LLHFSLISRVYSYAIVRTGYKCTWVDHVWDTFHVFLGHYFVSGLRTLKPKNLKLFL